MYPRILLLISTLIAYLSSFAQRNSYPNVLQLATAVEQTRKIEPTIFSDLGAWHGYALPARPKDYGAFIGPLLMDMRGEWLANTIAQLQVKENGRLIEWQPARSTVTYLPGLLQQTLVGEHWRVEMELIFVSSRQSLIHTRLINTGSRAATADISWQGKPLAKGSKLAASATGITVQFATNTHVFQCSFMPVAGMRIESSDSTYTALAPRQTLAPRQSASWTQLHTFLPDPAKAKGITLRYDWTSERRRNEQRWNGYLQQYFKATPSLTRAQKQLAVKSIITLTTNWRSKAKDLFHDGIFPSVNYQGFYGVWSWDSWKQAAGMALFNPQIAEQNIQCMFDYQDSTGMVPDCIYTEKGENNWRDTKPPLAAWAVWKVYEQNHHQAFVQQLYPKLVSYHQWWYKNRDHDSNGLCEYGSTDGTRIAAAWESGMDNAVRYDSAIMLKNNESAYSLNQESVDLNAYLYAEKGYLAKLAGVLHLQKDSLQWESERPALAQKINNTFYNTDKGYYYDRMINTGQQVLVEGTEGWIPLWAGIATPQQAKAVMRVMAHKARFNTLVPMPTLTASHPQFDPGKGYWRGPVWLDQFYFGCKGLAAYGYHSLASTFVQDLLNHGEGLLTDAPIHENYHPISGKGLNARNFSWSAAHLLLLFREIK